MKKILESLFLVSNPIGIFWRYSSFVLLIIFFKDAFVLLVKLITFILMLKNLCIFSLTMYIVLFAYWRENGKHMHNLFIPIPFCKKIIFWCSILLIQTTYFSQVKAVILGLGAGLLPMFLRRCIPLLDIEVILLDSNWGWKISLHYKSMVFTSELFYMISYG